MAQVAMRAGQRNTGNVTIGSPDGAHIQYKCNDQGVVLVHEAHVKALKSLGFHKCSDENPAVPAIASLSEEDWAGFNAFRLEQAKQKAAEAGADTAKASARK